MTKFEIIKANSKNKHSKNVTVKYFDIPSLHTQNLENDILIWFEVTYIRA